MKKILTLALLVLCLSAKAQTHIVPGTYELYNDTDTYNKNHRVLMTGGYLKIKDNLYYYTPFVRCCITPSHRFIDTCKMELDTPMNDNKGGFTVVVHGTYRDTVRNGIYEYRLIKKRVKN